MAQASGHPAHYDLYYNPFSICSLMVLYTLRLKGQPRSPADAVEPEQHLIDIYTGEQMTESYLEKHPKGSVPALLSPSQRIQLIDSTTITAHIIERYPSLRPAVHAQTIDALLEELHEIAYVILSFKPEERRVEGLMVVVREIMDRKDTSERYRGMLKEKHDGHAALLRGFAAAGQSVATVEADAATYLDKINILLSKHSASAPGAWIFGDDVGPTALDAHTVVFIARLLDAKREHLIPRDVLEYGRRQLQSEGWLGITKGESTLHGMFERGEGRLH